MYSNDQCLYIMREYRWNIRWIQTYTKVTWTIVAWSYSELRIAKGGACYELNMHETTNLTWVTLICKWYLSDGYNLFAYCKAKFSKLYQSV